MLEKEDMSSLKGILQKFLNHVDDLEAKRRDGEDVYEQEFQNLKLLSESLKTQSEYSCSEGEKEVNRRKNRYKDILPFDQSRVILSEFPGVPGSDYINGNYIKGASGSRAYIASQGPLPNTVNDFWRMVVETEVQVIVMACNEREAGKHKCECYWVTSEEETRTCGTVTIRLVKCRQISPDFLLRTLQVTYLTEDGSTDSRVVVQFHYWAWPDHGVPPQVKSLLDMVLLVRDVQSSETRPVLLHCSAGCGRTGTICSIDYVSGLLRTGKLRASFSLFDVIADMRRQRIAMVQTVDQYIMVHRAVRQLFLEQLKIIDSHPYENIDISGSLKVKSQPAGYEEVLLQQERSEGDGKEGSDGDDDGVDADETHMVPRGRSPVPPRRRAHPTKMKKDLEKYYQKGDTKENGLSSSESIRSRTLPASLYKQSSSSNSCISKQDNGLYHTTSTVLLPNGENTNDQREALPRPFYLKIEDSKKTEPVGVSKMEGVRLAKQDFIRKPSVRKLKAIFEGGSDFARQSKLSRSASSVTVRPAGIEKSPEDRLKLVRKNSLSSSQENLAIRNATKGSPHPSRKHTLSPIRTNLANSPQSSPDSTLNSTPYSTLSSTNYSTLNSSTNYSTLNSTTPYSTVNSTPYPEKPPISPRSTRVESPKLPKKGVTSPAGPRKQYYFGEKFSDYVVDYWPKVSGDTKDNNINQSAPDIYNPLYSQSNVPPPKPPRKTSNSDKGVVSPLGKRSIPQKAPEINRDYKAGVSGNSSSTHNLLNNESSSQQARVVKRSKSMKLKQLGPDGKEIYINPMSPILARKDLFSVEQRNCDSNILKSSPSVVKNEDTGSLKTRQEARRALPVYTNWPLSNFQMESNLRSSPSTAKTNAGKVESIAAENVRAFPCIVQDSEKREVPEKEGKLSSFSGTTKEFSIGKSSDHVYVNVEKEEKPKTTEKRNILGNNSPVLLESVASPILKVPNQRHRNYENIISWLYGNEESEAADDGPSQLEMSIRESEFYQEKGSKFRDLQSSPREVPEFATKKQPDPAFRESSESNPMEGSESALRGGLMHNSGYLDGEAEEVVNSCSDYLKNTRYTNVTLEARNNMLRLERSLEDHPRGGIYDVTSSQELLDSDQESDEEEPTVIEAIEKLRESSTSTGSHFLRTRERRHSYMQAVTKKSGKSSSGKENDASAAETEKVESQRKKPGNFPASSEDGCIIETEGLPRKKSAHEYETIWFSGKMQASADSSQKAPNNCEEVRATAEPTRSETQCYTPPCLSSSSKDPSFAPYVPAAHPPQYPTSEGKEPCRSNQRGKPVSEEVETPSSRPPNEIKLSPDRCPSPRERKDFRIFGDLKQRISDIKGRSNKADVRVSTNKVNHVVDTKERSVSPKDKNYEFIFIPTKKKQEEQMAVGRARSNSQVHKVAARRDTSYLGGDGNVKMRRGNSVSRTSWDDMDLSGPIAPPRLKRNSSALLLSRRSVAESSQLPLSLALGSSSFSNSGGINISDGQERDDQEFKYSSGDSDSSIPPEVPVKTQGAYLLPTDTPSIKTTSSEGSLTTDDKGGRILGKAFDKLQAKATSLRIKLGKLTNDGKDLAANSSGGPQESEPRITVTSQYYFPNRPTRKPNGPRDPPRNFSSRKEYV